jgi:hypothetical protein
MYIYRQERNQTQEVNDKLDELWEATIRQKVNNLPVAATASSTVGHCIVAVKYLTVD